MGSLPPVYLLSGCKLWLIRGVRHIPDLQASRRGSKSENPCTQQSPALPFWFVMGCQYTHHSYISSCDRLYRSGICCPSIVSYLSAKKLDVALNDTLRLIAGCLRPTPNPTGLLPLLADYQTCAVNRGGKPHLTIKTPPFTVPSQTCRASNHSA